MKNKFKKVSVLLFMAMFLTFGLTESVFADIALPGQNHSGYNPYLNNTTSNTSSNITTIIIWVGIILALLVLIIFFIIIWVNIKGEGNTETQENKEDIK